MAVAAVATVTQVHAKTNAVRRHRAVVRIFCSRSTFHYTATLSKISSISPNFRIAPGFDVEAVATRIKVNGVDLVIGAFRGVYAPRGTSADVMNTISAALGRVANSPELIEQMNSVGAGLVYLGRAEAPAY